MPILRHEKQFGYSNLSAFTIYGDLLGGTYLSQKEIKKEPDYEAYFNDKKQDILADCRSKSKKSENDCLAFVANGHAMFCKWTKGFSFCGTPPNFVYRPTTTTTTTIQTTTPVKSFPVGLLIGGFMAGALIGFILMIIVLCLCKKKEKTGNRKNGKHTTGTYSGNTGTATGTTATTSGTTGTTGITATKMKKKAKKAKKEKKGKNTSAETKTRSGL
ncbi:hypothetical protein CAEBREN_24235 [Caenorhabditis brenneri]|uniref:Uncharacterized protein n=1 Tax=Caenorhabditis brenneri TaxID=135651 RepID=G0N148_CAEBE|nr:hypothetical protein CAEBREN_24235 [Caenorhabditis brenneri]